MKKLLLLTMVLALNACVETQIDGNADPQRIVKNQPVVVVPEFHLSGIERVPAKLRVSSMGLTVSELRFAPVDTDGIAFTTVDPMVIKFDVSNGEAYKKSLTEIRLPDPGRYLVSMRLEPRPEEGFPQSFFMNGSVEEVVSIDEESDGWPQPVFDEKLAMKGWTPFRYKSRKTVFFTFNDITLQNGTQALAFEFDAANWSGSVVASISKAVRNTEHVNEDGVDVTNTVESAGDDFASLIETGIVENLR